MDRCLVPVDHIRMFLAITRDVFLMLRIRRVCRELRVLANACIKEMDPDELLFGQMVIYRTIGCVNVCYLVNLYPTIVSNILDARRNKRPNPGMAVHLDIVSRFWGRVTPLTTYQLFGRYPELNSVEFQKGLKEARLTHVPIEQIFDMIDGMEVFISTTTVSSILMNLRIPCKTMREHFECMYKAWSGLQKWFWCFIDIVEEDDDKLLESLTYTVKPSVYFATIPDSLETTSVCIECLPKKYYPVSAKMQRLFERVAADVKMKTKKNAVRGRLV